MKLHTQSKLASTHLLIGSVCLYSTGHWIGGTILALALIIEVTDDEFKSLPNEDLKP